MKDLFEDYQELPKEVQDFIENNPSAFEDGEYEAVAKALIQMQGVGYTFDFGLDGCPYNLRPYEPETNTVCQRGEVLTLAQIESLKVGDVVPNCFGQMKPIVEVFHKGLDRNGKLFCCFYQQFGNDPTTSMSNSAKEGERISLIQGFGSDII